MSGNGRAGIKRIGEEEKTVLFKILKRLLIIIFDAKPMSESNKVKSRRQFKGYVVNAWGPCSKLYRNKLSRHWFQIWGPPDLVQRTKASGKQ